MSISALIQKLRDKRQELAHREGIELYRVFTNATLEETARAAPKTKEDLALIKGWGPKKIAKYGDEILSLLNNPDPNSSSPVFQPKENEIFSVSQFLNFINHTLFSLGTIRVRGEITEINIRGGFAFAKLKDISPDNSSSVLNIYFNPSVLSYYSHFLEEGMEVIVSGNPNIYKSGRFSLIVQSLTPIGEGAIKKAFLALKAKLEERGWFASERKRPLPLIVRHIGLVTSRDGQALHDFLRNLGSYGFIIDLIDVRVEGDYAEEQLIRALNYFNRCPDLDAIVLIRGGGSLESLQAFNSEHLAETIISSRLPVIVGVGHEQDVSIADFVADLRVSTPTGAAIVLTRHREHLLENITAFSNSLTQSLSQLFISSRHRLEYLSIQLKSGLAQVFESLRNLEHQFLRHLDSQLSLISNSRHQLRLASYNLLQPPRILLENLRLRLFSSSRLLKSLNPETILARGYSIIKDTSGKVIKDSAHTEKEKRLSARLHRGSLILRVEDVK